MTREQKLAIMKERKNRMMNVKSVQNLKCGGVLKALTREIRNAEAALNAPMQLRKLVSRLAGANRFPHCYPLLLFDSVFGLPINEVGIGTYHPQVDR